MQIDILNLKAKKLIKNLEDLKLISIRKNNGKEFLRAIKKIRSKAKNDMITLDDITKEVELVRNKRRFN